MDRRSFFTSALNKSGKTVVKTIDARVKQQAVRWIRPPYAIAELEFLLSCTRCGDCIAACPHQVVFALSARVGAKFAGTPALDLLHKGCHLCADWPCVVACKPGALRLPVSEADDPDQADTGHNQALPMLASVRIDQQTCLPYNGPECGACISACPVPGALLLDSCKPVINKAICVGCGLCREACITEPKAIQITSLSNH